MVLSAFPAQIKIYAKAFASIHLLNALSVHLEQILILKPLNVELIVEEF